jgi:hypothetical protein
MQEHGATPTNTRTTPRRCRAAVLALSSNHPHLVAAVPQAQRAPGRRITVPAQGDHADAMLWHAMPAHPPAGSLATNLLARPIRRARASSPHIAARHPSRHAPRALAFHRSLPRSKLPLQPQQTRLSPIARLATVARDGLLEIKDKPLGLSSATAPEAILVCAPAPPTHCRR